MKKRAVILLELLVALSLTAILLTLLFSFLVQNAKMETKLDIVRQEISKRGYFQTRLQHILSAMDKGSPFYTDEGALLFQFDHGIDPNHLFSGYLYGKIEQEKDKIIFKMWPEEEELARKEILFTGVKRFAFEFLGPNRDSEKIRPINAQFAWASIWHDSWHYPSIIRLLIYESDKKEPLTFAFLIPTAELITY